MTTYGVTPTGFLTKPAATIKSESDTAMKGILGDSAGTEPDGSIPPASFAGQLIAWFVDGLSAMWDLGEAIYDCLDDAKAEDSALDVLCGLTGTLREAASKSTVTAACTGTPATTLLPGRQARVATTGTVFESTTAGGTKTIAAVSAWVGDDYVNVGDRCYNDTPNRVYECITAGTEASSGGPTGTGSDITDGSAHWRYLGDGTGAVDVDFEATETGALAATSGTLNEIVTPVAGWSGVCNVLDADVGHAEEGDSTLRVRRRNELAVTGNPSADGIRAAVLDVASVEYCRVFWNDTDTTDGDGVPAHSVEVLVRGGTAAAIVQAIFEAVPAGTRTYGSSSATVTDSAGNTHTIYYTRPSDVNIYITADVDYDADLFPVSTGADLIADALSLWGANNYEVGHAVRSSPLVSAVFDAPTETGGSPVPGILDVTKMWIGTAPSPSGSTTITLTARQLAVLDTSRMVITPSPGTP